MYFHELVELNRMESNRCQRSSAKASFDNIDNDFIVITTLEGAKREQSGTAVSRDRRVCFSLSDQLKIACLQVNVACQRTQSAYANFKRTSLRSIKRIDMKGARTQTLP